jgi:DNA modification methylase
MTITFAAPAKTLTNALGERSRAGRRKRKELAALEAVASAPRRNDLLPRIRLEQRAVSSLLAPVRLLRQVRADHVAEIARSISAFGVVQPILITADDKIVDGVSTVEAAKTIGLGVLPCIVVDHLKPEEIRLVRLALNRLGEKGSWDLDELKVEFAELLDFGATLELTGFTLPEIDVIQMLGDGAVDEAANDLPAKDTSSPAVTQLGDVWQLGRHRVLCADATRPGSYARLFDGATRAQAVFTDPPYNIRIDGFAVGAGNIKHREFVAASGEMTDDEFDTFLVEFLKAASVHLVDGGILFVCMDWRHAEHVQRAGRRADLSHINTVVWCKGNGGLGGLYRSAHEFVLVLRKGNGQSVNNVELGRHGRDRTNVWNYPGANQRGSSAHAELANHPTPKPVELVADALLDVTHRGDIVIDAFAGSGTTIIAAERTGRTAFTLELDPEYVDLIVRRFTAVTGIDAVHSQTGKTFTQLAAERQVEAVTDPGAASRYGEDGACQTSAGGSNSIEATAMPAAANVPMAVAVDNAADAR